jgi:tRNA nucleotidyltransferase (CCA-adding enzyme)
MVAASKLYPEAILVFSGSQEKNVRDYIETADLAIPLRKLKGLDLEGVTTVIVVDASTKKRIGPFEALVGKPGVTFHLYDHHPSADVDIPAQVAVIEKRGSSVTVLGELLQGRALTLTPSEATLLMLGLYEDTGSLSFPSVTSADYEIAGWLLESGANLDTVSRFIRRELDPAQVETLNELLHTVEIRSVHGVGVGVAYATAAKFVGDISTVTQKAMDIEGANAFFALVRIDDRVHFVGRSKLGAVNAANVARHLGGGGHPQAASATIRGKTLPQAVGELWAILNETVAPAPTAADLMTTHAIVVTPDQTIADAEKLFTRHDISGAPVVDEAGRVAGLITRQIVEKAIHHEMAAHPVAEFMILEFATIHPDAQSAPVEEILLGRRQKLLPVVDPTNGVLVGLVTRGMALSKLYGDSMDKSLPPGSPLAAARRRSPQIRDLSGLMKDRLPPSVIDRLNVIADLGNKNGVAVYAVGGFVRDLLMRIKNIDIDIVVEGDGIDFARKLADRLGARVRAHTKFKTAVVIEPEGVKTDVATARIEYYTHPAALPTVEMSAIRNDLYRRDFSINAMAIRLNGKHPWALIDYFGGQADIRDRAVRILHNLSFVEDPTRAFRAVRFEMRYGFSLGRQTLGLLKNAVRQELFHRVSSARLFAEIKLILSERRPIGALKRIDELGLFPFIDGALSFGPAQEKLFERLEDLFAWYTLSHEKNHPIVPWRVRMMALCDLLDTPSCDRLIARFPNGRKQLLAMKQERDAMRERGRSHALLSDPSPSELYALLAPFSAEGLLYLAAKIARPEITALITSYFDSIRDVAPFIGGEQLKQLGLPPSRRMKEILDAVRAAQLDGVVTDQNEAMAYAQRLVAQR